MSWRRGQRYSQDLRDRVLASVDVGEGVYRVAEIFGVSVSYIYKALDRRRKTGESGPNPNRGHRPRKLTPAQEAALEARIGSQADITLARLQDWLLAEHGVRLSDGAIWMAVHRLKLSFKKKPAGRRTRSSRRGRPASDLARRAELRRS
jgi:transposase